MIDVPFEVGRVNSSVERINCCNRVPVYNTERRTIVCI